MRLLTYDDGPPLAGCQEQPVVHAIVAVVRHALGVTGSMGHLDGMRMLVAEDNLEAIAESQVLVLTAHSLGMSSTSPSLTSACRMLCMTRWPRSSARSLGRGHRHGGCYRHYIS